MLVIQITQDGNDQKLIVESLEEAEQIIFGEALNGAEIGDKYSFEIIAMPEGEFQALKDFDGF